MELGLPEHCASNGIVDDASRGANPVAGAMTHLGGSIVSLVWETVPRDSVAYLEIGEVMRAYPKYSPDLLAENMR
jgi:hypothetical protein